MHLNILFLLTTFFCSIAFAQRISIPNNPNGNPPPPSSKKTPAKKEIPIAVLNVGTDEELAPKIRIPKSVPSPGLADCHIDDERLRISCPDGIYTKNSSVIDSLRDVTSKQDLKQKPTSNNKIVIPKSASGQ